MTGRVSIAFVAHGELFLLDGAPGQAQPRKVESKFADQYRARVRSMQRKQAWKDEGAGARFMRGGGSALWGSDAELEAIPVAVTGVARGKDGKVLYTISTGVVGGLLELDPASGDERRLYHSADRRIEQIATSDHHDVIACTMRGKGGTSVIGVMAADGSELFAITDGDVIDLAPQWLPSEATRDGKHQLVYHSAGIGRDAAGQFVAVGPAAVALIDAEAGAMQVLFEDPTRDFLLPRMDAQRTVYCVRHAYADTSDPGLGRIVLDALLFPFRLMMAVVGFLSFFTLRYTGRPLFTSGDARRRSADIRQMMMTGNLAAAQADADKDAATRAARAVRDWELVAIGEDRKERTVARGVRAYDLVPGGGVVVTDGHRIELVAADGKRTKLCEERLVSEVVVLG